MPTRSRLVALAIAVVAATLGTGLLWLHLERYEQQVAGGAPVSVLMTLEPLERGEILSADQLAVREVPEAYVEDRFVRAFDRAKVLGLRVAHHVGSQQLLLWTDLALASDEPQDLSSLIPAGSRAVSVRAANAESGASLVRPGDYVDVIANLPGELGAPRAAVVLLQKTLVLAVGSRTERDPGGASRAGFNGADATVTLSVNLRQAQLLSLAAQRGTLRLALRNPDDPRVTDGAPDLSAIVSSAPVRSLPVPATGAGPVRLEVARP